MNAAAETAGIGPPVDISLVIPVYDVAAYLPDLLASLSSQREPGCRYEVVLVDDGSTDASPALIAEWLESYPRRARVISQVNSGVSAARNAGLEASTGTWVTFPDADDVLDANYLRAAWRFLRSKGARGATVVASRVLRLDDRTGRIQDDHPLRFRFESRARTVDMTAHPDFFQLHAASTFIRRTDIGEHRFPLGVHASEDALFLARVLLDCPRAVLGVNRAARYHYRRRATGDSATDRYASDPVAAYRDRFGRDYVRLLDDAARLGGVPDWLQSMVLYEFQWALAPWSRVDAPRPAVDAETGDAILRAIAACAERLDQARILSYDATALPLDIRCVLLALQGSPLPDTGADLVDYSDAERGVTRVRRYEVRHIAAGAESDGARRVHCFAPTPVVETTSWVPGVSRISLRSRAEMDDAARRRLTGQSRSALPSRASDVRVRRVRRMGVAGTARSLGTYVRERARRGAFSKAGLARAVARLVVRVGREAPGVWVPAERRSTADGSSGGMTGFSAALAAARGDEVIAAARPAARFRAAHRPRADRWRATITGPGPVTYDDELAVADAAPRAIVRD